MANSRIKEDIRLRSAKVGGGLQMFRSQIQGIIKEKKKAEHLQENNLQKYNPELNFQNSDSSKETTNDLTTCGKTYSTSCLRKSYNQISNPHQNDEAPDFIKRVPRRSNEYCLSTSRNIKNHNFEKPYFDKNDKRNNPKDTFRKNHPKYNCKSDQHFKFQNNNFEPHYSSIEAQDNKEEKGVFNKLDFENHSEDEDTEIKHERLCSELDETVKDSALKNIKITIKPYNSDSSPNTSLISSSSLTSSVSNEPNSLVLNVSTLNTSSPVSPPSSISNISSVSSPISILKANYDLPSNTVLSNVFENLSSNYSSVGILNSSDDNLNFIPPPVSTTSPSISENFCYSTGTNENLFQNNGPEFSGVSSYAAEVDLSLPDSEHIEAISKYILKVVEERSVSFTAAYKVVYDLNRLFKNHFEGNVIDYYGSYYTDLAITTSDINLMIQTEFSIRKSFMLEIYNILSKELERYHVHQCEEGSTAHKTKINFTHPDTGINCELAYLGRNRDNIFKMGKFLKDMCQKNHHVKPLIIAAKVWAEHFNINEVEDGKLHPIGFSLLIIHFLQHCENPILPVYSCAEEIMEKLPQNDSSIGTLWLGFLKYFAFTFNWQEDVLTVTSRSKVSKKSKKWETYWIAIEDPFTGKNIAESVTNKDVADYIISCFKETYNYFVSGPGILPSSDNEDNRNVAESSSSQLKFSFNDCIVEQSENICEACDDIDDVCEDCKKKIYVQPMASVPKMTDEFLKIVKKALSTVYDKYMLSDKDVKDRRFFVQKLENNVRKVYPGAQMHLFGSSANGFGFKNSDLDICMTFEPKKEYKPCAVLRDLRYLLRKDKDFINVIAIFDATIPILKFRYKPRGWRCDISLDNVLAFHNSELLHTYSLIDDRCKILGCALKLIAKKALIAEVTEKALSSYSYLIMVIHFLQQTDPPVLPILQDNEFRENFELEDIIENCNVWFCHNIDYIKKKFKTTNDTPVEQLFLDLLDYYCSFDTTQLISIKQKEIQPVPEGMPTARLFNIQDPFLVLKNLGRVVSTTKAQETKNVLNKARQLFRTPKKEPTDLESYFFSTMNLTGRYQTDSLCDFCGKFGHDQKDCRQFLSPFQKNNFLFKRYPRNKQNANQNGFFKRNR